jgi:XRE family transcriptional regulator, fatty acid utilization regulator
VVATLKERFGENLREVRVQNELSMAELGRLSGLSHSEVSRLEAGIREPRLATVLALARALDAEVTDLIRGLH